MHFPKQNLRNILFFDIETASAHRHFDELSPDMQASWQKWMAGRRGGQKYDMDDGDQVLLSFDQRAAIYAEFGRVVCISVGYLTNDVDGQFRIKSFYGDDESVLLSEFSTLLQEYFYDIHSMYLCGHNIREFDIPFLCRRLMILEMPLPNILRVTGKKAWQLPHILDTMELWKFGDHKHYTSLDILCSVLGLPSPKDQLSGDQVSSFFWQGRVDEIARYCEKDVLAVARLYLRCCGLGVINDDQVYSQMIIDKG